jgi:hypothetical protein
VIRVRVDGYTEDAHTSLPGLMHRHSRIFDQVKWVEDINIRRLAIGDEKNRAVVASLTLHYRRGMPQCSADAGGMTGWYRRKPC